MSPLGPDTVLLRPTGILLFISIYGMSKKESLLPSSKYLDPKKEPCKWLGAVLIDLLEQDTEESREALKWAFPRMAQWLTPGLVDQLFAPWIEDYLELLDEHENNQSTESLKSQQADPLVCKE